MITLARDCARPIRRPNPRRRWPDGNPVALSRLEYQPDNATVTYHSDKPTGPTAGSETMDVLEFLARVTSHIPAKCQVLQRYYGWYASRGCEVPFPCPARASPAGFAPQAFQLRAYSAHLSGPRITASGFLGVPGCGSARRR